MKMTINPKLQPGAKVRLASGGRTLSFVGFAEDGDLMAAHEVLGEIKAIEARPEMFVLVLEEPVVIGAPEPEPVKKKRQTRPLKEPEPGSFLDKVRQGVKAGMSPMELAEQLDRPERVIAMTIGRLRKNGYLPKA